MRLFLNKLPKQSGYILITLGVLLFYPFMRLVIFGSLALFTNDKMTGEKFALALVESFFVQLLIFHVPGTIMIILGVIRLRND